MGLIGNTGTWRKGGGGLDRTRSIALGTAYIGIELNCSMMTTYKSLNVEVYELKAVTYTGMLLFLS
jgi:hypothetical protein